MLAAVAHKLCSNDVQSYSHPSINVMAAVSDAILLHREARTSVGALRFGRGRRCVVLPVCQLCMPVDALAAVQLISACASGQNVNMQHEVAAMCMLALATPSGWQCALRSAQHDLNGGRRAFIR